MISSAMNSYLALLALVSSAVAQKCPLQFDGRVPAGSTPASFDETTSPFGTKFVFGQSESRSLPNCGHVADMNRLDMEQDY